MTESSILWENNGTGDGVSGGYSQAKLVEWMRALFTKSANRGGVSPDYLNTLAVTGTSSPVAVASGAALVYGFMYFSDASVNVTVGTPVSSTRIDRVVLRADWTAQTVRITRIAGSEGSGSPPALSQNAGTTWDVPLAQVSITTGGVITVTDEREWLDATGDGLVTAAKLAADAVTTAKILNSNVTAAKLATDAVETAKIKDANVTTAKIANDAVDDTKVGARVPQFYRRQGGDASTWNTAGTTTYTPGAVRMQAGVVSGAFSGGTPETGGVAITFPVAFSDKPIVLAMVESASTNYQYATSVTLITASGCQVYWRIDGHGSAGTLKVHWLAIGPE